MLLWVEEVINAASDLFKSEQLCVNAQVQLHHDGSRKTFCKSISAIPNSISILCPFLPHLLELYDCAHKMSARFEWKWAEDFTKCWPELFQKQNMWNLPYCCIIVGSEFCPCIWQGRDFYPPSYLQYRTWIYARNFSRSGSKRSCRKTDHFVGELIASYSFPLIYSLTQAHTLMIKVIRVLRTAQKVILAHSPVAVLTWWCRALMFTLYIVNIITKQIPIASFLILFLCISGISSYPPAAVRFHYPYWTGHSARRKK